MFTLNIEMTAQLANYSLSLHEEKLSTLVRLIDISGNMTEELERDISNLTILQHSISKYSSLIVTCIMMY